MMTILYPSGLRKRKLTVLVTGFAPLIKKITIINENFASKWELETRPTDPRKRKRESKIETSHIKKKFKGISGNTLKWNREPEIKSEPVTCSIKQKRTLPPQGNPAEPEGPESYTNPEICKKCIYCHNCYSVIPAELALRIRWISKEENHRMMTPSRMCLRTVCPTNSCVSCVPCHRSTQQLNDYFWDPRPQCDFYTRSRRFPPI